MGNLHISLIQNEIDRFLRNLILGTELKVKYLDADDVKDIVTKTYMKKMSKEYSFHTQKMMLRKSCKNSS